MKIHNKFANKLDCAAAKKKIEKQQQKLLKVVPKKVQDDTSCQTCELFIQMASYYVTHKSGSQEVESVLYQLCQYTGSWNSTCQAMINASFDDIVYYIKQNEDPKAICEYLAMCDTSKVKNIDRITEIALKFRQYLKALGNDSQDCDDCKAIIEFIEGFLTNGMSIQQIDTMIKNYVCANLGAEQNLCDEIINQIPVLVDYISKHMSKEGICAEIGICSE